MASILCPFCNAALSLDELPQTGTKILCPRCGEPLPPHLVKDLPVSPVLPNTLPPTSPGWTNRKIGLSIFGIMLLMGVIGLTMALLTVESRRKNDYRGARNEVAPPTVQAPGQLSALGFLPADTNIVAAVQVAELFKDAAGRKLLEMPRPALLELALSTIERWTKLRAEDLDHIVIGTEIKTKLPQVTVVVECRQPYEPAALAKALLPAAPTLQRGKPFFRFELQPGQGILWCPQPRTLVLLFRLNAFKAEDLEAIPLSPRTGTNAPPLAIQDILARRVNKQSLVWLAGNVGEPDLIKEFLAPLPAGDAQFLTKVQGLALSLYSQDGLVLDGHFRTGDEKTLGLVQVQLEGLSFPNMRSLKVVPPPRDGGPEEQWLTLQMRGEPQAIRAALDPWGKGK